MRMSQPQGLPDSARVFLNGNAVRIDVCSHCGRDSGYEKREIGRTGMYDDLPLFEYDLKDGRTAKEVVQAEPWSSGPMVFLGLVVSDRKFFYWDQETIDNAR